MEATHKEVGLKDVLVTYGVPDPRIVGKLPKGGIQLDFVGHADVTKMLIEIDPCWSWEPVAFDTDGLPAYRIENGMAHMAGWLTVHGVRRLGIGSVAHNKPDLLKELCSDFIRNSAMRFGICLSLWTKQEWDDIPTPSLQAKQAESKTQPYPQQKSKPVQESAPSKKPRTLTPLSPEQVEQFVKACADKGIDPKVVASNAEIPEGQQWMESHLPSLRKAFKELVAFKEGQ
jgi:hypothetical protein